jgi:hypothetical protein
MELLNYVALLSHLNSTFAWFTETSRFNYCNTMLKNYYYTLNLMNITVLDM